MYQSILYKEWIKTGRLVVILFLVLAAATGYLFINVAQTLRVGGAINTWEAIITQDLPLVSTLKWLPLLLGVVLSLAQYVPEMQSKRLKLTLHLPMNEVHTLSTMMLYGLVLLMAMFALLLGAIVLGFNVWFAPELTANALTQLLPWLLAALLGYTLTAWVCLEPTWRQRMINFVIMAAALAMFFIPSFSTGYKYFIPLLAFFVLLSVLFPFFSVARFKEGAQ
ncbi:MAG: hypothetical protein ACK5LR_06870 [Mangrovibacterium sp.]